MSGRFRELDSLRGVAAASVVSFHILMTLPGHGGWLWRAPFVNGHEAVLVFFVLSGFVLSLAYVGREAPPTADYGRFLVRRFCRIYLPYAGAIACATALVALHKLTLFTEFDPEVNRIWQTATPLQMLAMQADLFSNIGPMPLDGVAWTLAIEMRVALVLPLLALLALRLRTRAVVALGMALDLGVFLVDHFREVQGLSTDMKALGGAAVTLHYVPMFLAGILLARNLDRLTAAYAFWPGWLRSAFGLMGLALLYKHGWIAERFAGALPPLLTHVDPGLQVACIEDWLATAGAVALMLTIVASGRVAAFMRREPLAFLGRISYSLYLYHVIVMGAVVSLLGGLLPPAAVVAVELLASTAVAWASYRLAEVPAMRLGRFLTSKARQVAAPSGAAQGL